MWLKVILDLSSSDSIPERVTFLDRAQSVQCQPEPTFDAIQIGG